MADTSTIPIYDMQGEKPALGSIDHNEVHDAVASGKFSLPKGTSVPVVSPDGDLGTLDASEAHEAFNNGYRYATPQMQKEIKYSGFEQGAKAFLEGAGEGVAGPLAPALEKGLGIAKEEDIRGRREERSGMHGLGQAVGLGTGLMTGTGVGGLMSKVGEAAELASGIGQASKAAKIGSEAVKQAAEMAVLGGSDEVSKMVLNDPDQSAQSAIANVGLSAAMGGAGGAFVQGALSPIWKATVGDKLGAALGGLKSKLNQESESTILQEAKELGLNLKPEVASAMSEDPLLRNAASGLRQTDTSKIARGYQATENEFKNSVTEKMAETLGKTPGELGATELSEASTGKDVGDTLAKEYKSKLDPIIDSLESTKDKFKGAELAKDTVSKIQDFSNPYNPVVKDAVTPGVTAQLGDKISKMALDEGWMTDRLSPEARLVSSTLKELASKNSLGDLVKMGVNIGNRTKSTLPFGVQTPLSRAGTMLRGILRDAENSVIMDGLEKEAPGMLEKYRGALDQYKDIAQIKDQLNDRLKISNSVSGFAKGLSDMAKTDSESLLNKLRGTKDSHLLGFLTEHFPETAQKLKQYHVDQLLEKATMVGKEGSELNPGKLMKEISKMSPELRQFALGQENVSKLTRLNEFLTKLHDQNHNFSNTARTVDKILQHGPGTSLGMIAALTGHGATAVLAPLVEMLGREGQSGARLAMLKFLGSNQPIKSEGFKAAVDFIHNTYKGENLLSKATKSLFDGGAKVLGTHMIPDQKDRDKLDKIVDESIRNPNKFMATASSTDPNGSNDPVLGHYMDQHQTAVTQATTQATQYLQHLKPQPSKPGPMDAEIPPSDSAIARYNRALDTAQQPAMVLQHIADGTLLASDVQDIHNMYPALYQNMVGKITHEMTSYLSKGETVPYHTRIAMSLFLGQPLDSSMQPQSIMAAQPKPQPEQQQMASNKKAKSTSPLGKSNKMYETASQSAEADRSGRKA